MLSFLKGDKRQGESGGWLSRLRTGLTATREKLSSQLSALLGRHSRIDESLYEELETLLGIRVDVLTPGDLPEKFRARVLAEARPV